jgi:hypothetical protein
MSDLSRVLSPLNQKVSGSEITMTIKKKDIVRIVRDYQPAFPGWEIPKRGTEIVRVESPVLQGIVFDRSPRDIYRPTGYIRVLTAPKSSGVMDLVQDLKRANGAPQREVTLLGHKRERDEIVSELYRQMRPKLDEPLDPLEVLEMYEREAVPKVPEAYSIATLCAYLGYEAKARDWIRRFRELEHEWEQYWLSDPKRKRYSTAKWFQDSEQIDEERKKFIDDLEEWLDKGEARERLETVIQEERKKLGLA